MANRMLDGISEEQIATIQAGLARSASVGQRRMLELTSVPFGGVPAAVS